MHDPSTVAHEIKYPWKKRPSKLWPEGYRESFITIWHNDPLKFVGKCGQRDDDSCGWFSPVYTLLERESYEKLAKNQYGQLFAKKIYQAEGKDYASAGYEATCYDAIYWCWRALKAMGKNGWQYSKPLSLKELDAIFKLDSNPVDNLRYMFQNIHDEQEFQRFFFCIARAFRRHYRPWYLHPRWHVHHWSLQIHPLQALKRRYWDKCCKCGKRGFKKGDCAMGDWSGTTLWHSGCENIGVTNNV